MMCFLRPPIVTWSEPSLTFSRTDSSRIELRALLIEVRCLQLRAEPDVAALRREIAEHQAQQRALAAAVRSDDADAVAAADRHRQIAHEHLLAVAEADALEIGDDLAGSAAAVEIEIYCALQGDALSPFLPQRFEPTHAPFVARAPRFDAFADPHFFFCEELVEIRVLTRFHFEHLLFARRGTRRSCRETTRADRDRVRRCARRVDGSACGRV